MFGVDYSWAFDGPCIPGGSRRCDNARLPEVTGQRIGSVTYPGLRKMTTRAIRGAPSPAARYRHGARQRAHFVTWQSHRRSWGGSLSGAR
jgi:hypothetical protein